MEYCLFYFIFLEECVKLRVRPINVRHFTRIPHKIKVCGFSLIRETSLTAGGGPKGQFINYDLGWVGKLDGAIP